MPLRGGGGGGRRLMANTILNFHFDYWNTSLSLNQEACHIKCDLRWRTTSSFTSHNFNTFTSNLSSLSIDLFVKWIKDDFRKSKTRTLFLLLLVLLCVTLNSMFKDKPNCFNTYVKLKLEFFCPFLFPKSVRRKN